jgi:hypothetical protein
VKVSRIPRNEPRTDGADVRARGIERHPRREPRECVAVAGAVVRGGDRVANERRPDLGSLRQHGALRYDANHNTGRAVDHEGPADDRAIAAEPPAPERFCEHDDV